MQAVAQRPRIERVDSPTTPALRLRLRGAGRQRSAASFSLEAIALGVLLACITAEAAVLQVGIDDLDEGYFLQQATRIYRYDQLPYRDFESLYTPGLTYLHVLLFWLHGGVWLLGARLLALGGRAALVGMMYVLARPLVKNPLWAALPGVVLLLAFDDAPVRWEPHPGWLSTAFALVAVWCLTRGISARWLVAAGLAAAGSYAFKQNTGVFILGALLLRCGLNRRALLPVAAFGTATALWLVPLAIGVGDVKLLAGFVGAANVADLFAPPEPTMLVPLACLIAGTVVLRRRATWLLLAGMCLYLTQFPRMDTLHLQWSAPLLLVVGAAAMERLPRIWSALALACVVLLAWPTMTQRVDLVRTARTDLYGLELPQATASDLGHAVKHVQDESVSNEPIFVYPTAPLVYVLADRPNPTRFDHLNPGAASPVQIETLIGDLQRTDVSVVVVSDYWRSAWGPPGPNAALDQWLAANFVTVADDGSYRVVRRL
ncbi:MAG: hypothetical protein JOZ81_28255 [Chloroflexi bacterium]|nr:hypothetical protein [Chloroflexota bacterium]